MSRNSAENQGELLEETQHATEEPPIYKVLLHNDDYTTMDFVVQILEELFHKSPAEAMSIMLNVHHQGIGICGLYPREIAETKVSQVHARARNAGFPLRASIERG